MSATPSFQSVIFTDGQLAEVYQRADDSWKLIGSSPLSSQITESLAALINATNVLVIVSDQVCGHLQLTQPNKKEELSDERIGTVLRDEYEIDLDSYEFASQQFTLSRDQVQVSISGIEREVFDSALKWVAMASPKRVWLMPFAWFLSPLKSIEPVLLGWLRNEEELFVSHHYLGVDDARVIKPEQIGDYSKARKDERKETHLFYLHAPEKQLHSLAKKAGDLVAIHALLPEDITGGFGELVAAIMEKGEDTLRELLHFEVKAEEVAALAPTPVVQAKPAKKSSRAKAATVVQEVPETSPEARGESSLPEPSPEAAELPKPDLPPVVTGETVAAMAGAGAVTTIAEEILPDSAPEVEHTEAAHVHHQESVVEESPVHIQEVAVPEVMSEPEMRETPPEVANEPSMETPPAVAASVPETPALDMLAELRSAKQSTPKVDRYQAIPEKKPWKLIIAVFLIVTVATAVIAGAIFWSQQGANGTIALLPDVNATPTPSPSPTPEPTPEPTPVPETGFTEAEKADLDILVLNATGINGLAGVVKTELQKDKWESVKTGNATGSYNDAIFVRINGDRAGEIKAALEKDLGYELTVIEKVTENGAATADIVIILAEDPR